MIGIYYSNYRHLFLTNGKVASSTLAGLPGRKTQYDHKSSIQIDLDKGKFQKDKIVLMLRNPKDRFRSGLFTTLYYDREIRNKTIEEWIDIITSYLKESKMFVNNANSWEQYHCMPYLYNSKSLIESLGDFTPVHLNRLSDYLEDFDMPVSKQNDSTTKSDIPNFYNAFAEAIKNFKTEYNFLLENDLNMYNSLLTSNTLSKKYL